MRVYFKIARCLDDEEVQAAITDFGYYSTINWNLVRELEKHCKNNALLEIDYIMPNEENRLFEIHTDNLKISNTNQRLYLRGLLKNSKKFSNIPVDRIFMVKTVLREHKRLKIYIKPLVYIVSKEAFKNTKPDSKEVLVEYKDNYAIIKSVVDDDFYILQRLLYFAPDVYYISNNRIKALYKQKLKDMKGYYGN